MFLCLFFFQVELFEKDIEYIRTELNHASAADTSPISLYEYFHISPIKVWTLHSVLFFKYCYIQDMMNKLKKMKENE